MIMPHALSHAMPEQLPLIGVEPPPRNDRLFFAVFPDALTAERIAALGHRVRADQQLPGPPLRTDRLHVTLHHLGDFAGVPQRIVDAAKESAATLSAAAFELRFDQFGSFKSRTGNHPGVLRTEQPPEGLMTFQHMLGETLQRHGVLSRSERTFTPHVTLFYAKRQIPPQPVDAVRWVARVFVLVHGLIGHTRHILLGHWPLR